MKNLLPGILFTMIGLVVLDGVGGIISTSAEYVKTSIGLKIAQKQVKINELAAQQEQSSVRAIGFAIDPEYEEEDDYDE